MKYLKLQPPKPLSKDQIVEQRKRLSPKQQNAMNAFLFLSDKYIETIDALEGTPFYRHALKKKIKATLEDLEHVQTALYKSVLNATKKGYEAKSADPNEAMSIYYQVSCSYGALFDEIFSYSPERNSTAPVFQESQSTRQAVRQGFYKANK